jgi:hypothetical protein
MFNYIIKYRYNLFLRFTHVICMQVFIFWSSSSVSQCCVLPSSPRESLNKKSKLWNVSDLRNETLPECQREHQLIFARMSIQSLNYHCTILTQMQEGFFIFSFRNRRLSYIQKKVKLSR